MRAVMWPLLGVIVAIPAPCAILAAQLARTVRTAASAPATVAVAPWHATYYRLDLRVDPETKSIRGTTSIQAVPSQSGMHTLSLDIARQLVVDEVRVNGHHAAVTRVGDVLAIPLDPSRARSPMAITVAYHGQPDTSLFVFATNGGSPVVASWGMPYSARQWWPSQDTPNDKADSADIIVTVPPTLTAASNGRLIATRHAPGGWLTYHWAVRYPIYADVVSLAIADYRTFTHYYRYSAGDSMPMTYYVYPAHLAKAKESFSLLPLMMASHVGRFGPYPFLREKYGVAEFPVHSYREHQTLPSYGALFVTGDHTYDRILAHELAHQWFGNLVTVQSWRHVWLNEGFAQYAVSLWKEQSEGRAAYDSTMRSFDRADFAGPIVLDDTTSYDALFSSTTFAKAAWVLHMLRHVVGDTVFFRTLPAYVQRYQHQTVVTEDFQHVVEEQSGQSLSDFFQQWLYGTGRPRLHLTWAVTGDETSGYDLAISLAQVQRDGTQFTTPVDIGVARAGGDTTVVMRLAPGTATTHVHLMTRPQGVTLDPDNWLLKDIVP